jgi:predicted house-cleaning NTP pyrophosphatase (Maf/HAM1 superfamily)
VNEEAIKHIVKSDRRGAADRALALVETKARQVAKSHRSDLGLGVDQIHVYNSSWFNKAVDLADASAQL